MKKNIYQLAKLFRRANRRSTGALCQLTKDKRKNPVAKPWKGPSDVNVEYQRARLSICAKVILAIKEDLLTRRVGLTPARPAKVNPPLPKIVCPEITPAILEQVAALQAV